MHSERKRKDKRHGGSARTACSSASPYAWIVPNATVFLSSACIMVIELVAGRVIARHLGASLYTWTSVIGIVLAGIGIGNYIGGRLADRFAPRRILANLFMASSVAAASISVLTQLVGDLSFLWMLPWPARVATHVALLFFLPACVLGMIGPVAAKMALDLGHKTGRTLGTVYAWGMVGSILATFMTGFWLVAWFGTMTVIWGVAGVLALMGILYHARSWRGWASAAVVVLLGTLTTGASEGATSWGERLALRAPQPTNVLYTRESQYAHVEVVQVTKSPDVRDLHLDALLHSRIDFDDPGNLRYEYARVYAAIAARLRPDRPPVDSLTIGGGGYVFPRYMASRFPGGRTDVVEIDRVVTQAATVAFGLPEDTRIRSFHEDGRVLIDRLSRQKRLGEPIQPYDLILLDAFNDYTVPYQLTTVEFVTKVRGLTKPDGAYLLMLIDRLDSGRFLGAVVNTMKRVFPYVYVFVEGATPSELQTVRSTFVVAGMNLPFDVADLGKEYSEDCTIHALPESIMATLADRSNQLVLTDDYAPVEHLLAPVVKAAAADKRAGNWLSKVRIAITESRFDQAIAIAERALARQPSHVDLLTELGSALRRRGDFTKAVAKLGEAVRLDSNHRQAHDELIKCYLALGQTEKTLPHYEAIVDYHPLVRHNYGNALLALGRYRAAVEQFEEVMRRQPTFADAYNNCGVALHRLGDRQGAIEHYRRALRVDPNHAYARPSLKALLGAPGQKRGSR